MPDYLTGRERVAVFAGTIGGAIQGVYVPGMPPRWDRYVTVHGAAGLLLSFTAAGSVAPLSYTTEMPWSRRLEVTLGVGLPSGGTSGTVTDAGTATTPGPFLLDCSGSFTVSVPLQEVFRYTEGSSTVSYGGTPHADYPPAAGVKFFERPKPGGTASCSVTFGTLSISLTKVLGTADAVIISDDGQTTAEVYDTGLAGTAFTYGTVLGQSVQATLVGGNTYGTASTSSGAWAASKGNSGHVIASVRRWPDRIYRLDAVFPTPAGNLYTEIADDPMLLDVAVKSGTAVQIPVMGGSAGTAWTQERYAAGLQSGLWGSESNIGSASLNEHGSVWAAVNAGWLDNELRDPREWRLLQRGKRFGGLTLSHAGTTVLETGPFDHVGGGTTTRTYSPVRSAAAYRYLDLFTDRPNEQTLQMQIGTKTYAGTGFPDGRIRFDLCGPVNGTATYDVMRTRWPLPTADDALGTVGAYWGKQLVGTAVLTGGAAGTISVGTVALVRSGTAPVVSLGPEHLLTFTRYVSGGGTVRRILYAEVDGRTALEVPDVYPPTIVTIGSAVSEVNQIGTAPWDTGGTVWAGWSATLDSSIDYADGGSATLWGTAFLNRNRPATWLAGGGIYRDGTVWRTWHGTPPGSVPSQVMLDMVETYGRSGDPWDLTGTAYGTAPFPVAAARWFRGVVHGIVYSAAPTPNPGVIVTVEGVTVLGQADSYGTADSVGRYRTGPPAAHGVGAHTVFTTGGTIAYPIVSPLPQRLCWAVPTVADWVTYDVSSVYRHLRAERVGGNIFLWAAQDAPAATWNQYASGIAGRRPCVRVFKRSLDSRLEMVYETAGSAVVWAVSPDEGRSWQVAGTVASAGGYPEMVITQDGRRYVYWHNGGTIWGRLYDAVGNPLHGPFAVVTGAQEKFAAQEHLLGWAGWRMHLIYRTTGGALIDLASSDGINFS